MMDYSVANYLTNLMVKEQAYILQLQGRGTTGEASTVCEF